jgi:hypothetical protein
VGVQLLAPPLVEALAVGDCEVALDVSLRAHAGDDGRHGWLAQYVAQGSLRDLGLGDREIGRDPLNPFVYLAWAVAAEIVRAVIVFGELAVGLQRAVKPPSSSGTRGITPMSCSRQAPNSSS